MRWAPSYRRRIIGLRRYAGGAQRRLSKLWKRLNRRYPVFRTNDWGPMLVAATKTRVRPYCTFKGRIRFDGAERRKP